jgi:hypothetical protein
VDRTRDKTTFIAGLLAIGFLVAGFVMWSHENARADHTMSVALLIAGGVDSLIALVVGATDRRASIGSPDAAISGN